MKIYISADMEGITTTTQEKDCLPGSASYPYHARQMTAEVAAACEGAIEAGATEIYVNDAHEEGGNIDSLALPRCVKLIKNWTWHPYGMVEGINSTFDACIFIGYHAGAGEDGNPISHTISHDPLSVKMNGRSVSEFMIYSYVAALEGVPVVFLAGDKQACDDSTALHPPLVTVSVKEGIGEATIALQPEYACELIRKNTALALKQDLQTAQITLPQKFQVEVSYHKHFMAEKMSYFPGARKINANTISYSADNYFDVKRFFSFVL